MGLSPVGKPVKSNPLFRKKMEEITIIRSEKCIYSEILYFSVFLWFSVEKMAGCFFRGDIIIFGYLCRDGLITDKGQGCNAGGSAPVCKVIIVKMAGSKTTARCK